MDSSKKSTDDKPRDDVTVSSTEKCEEKPEKKPLEKPPSEEDPSEPPAYEPDYDPDDYFYDPDDYVFDEELKLDDKYFDEPTTIAEDRLKIFKNGVYKAFVDSGTEHLPIEIIREWVAKEAENQKFSEVEFHLGLIRMEKDKNILVSNEDVYVYYD